MINSKPTQEEFDSSIHLGLKMLNDDYGLMQNNPTEENIETITRNNGFGIFGMSYAKFAKPRGLRLYQNRNNNSENSLRAISFYGKPGSSLELDFFEYGKIYLEPLSVCIFPNVYPCNVNVLDGNRYIEQFFEYEEEKLEPGPGESIFTVTATCTDQYEIQVVATNKDEAIAKAKFIPPHEWDHLDIFPEIQESQILRVTKWAQFGIKE